MRGKPVRERVILVDADDREIGTAEKIAAHRKGLLHRAVSVFVFDDEGRLLLQRRAVNKYHSGGLWANTCCSHPRPGESAADAAHRRLRAEMGVECTLTASGVFTYQCDVGSGLVENEIDHLFVGRLDTDPSPNPAEVQAFRWSTLQDVWREIRARPERFAPWLAPALSALEAHGPLAASLRVGGRTTD